MPTLPLLYPLLEAGYRFYLFAPKKGESGILSVALKYSYSECCAKEGGSGNLRGPLSAFSSPFTTLGLSSICMGARLFSKTAERVSARNNALAGRETRDGTSGTPLHFQTLEAGLRMGEQWEVLQM